jgi:hypothetical protein
MVDEGWPRQYPQIKNFGSGEKVRRMNSKVNRQQGESDCIIETKLGLQAKSQRVPLSAPLGLLYRWSGLRGLVGYDTTS